MTTYKIVRFYQDDDSDDEVIATGLTLEQAQAHCEDPEAGSTATRAAEAVTRRAGNWFDGYIEE